jgi:hypothetical protein
MSVLMLMLVLVMTMVVKMKRPKMDARCVRLSHGLVRPRVRVCLPCRWLFPPVAECVSECGM